MGYWDEKEKKNAGRTSVFDRMEAEKRARQKRLGKLDDEDNATAKPEETLEDYEKEQKEAFEEQGKYLSGKIKETMNRMHTVTSDGYYFVVYFNNDAQCDEFLDKLGYHGSTARYYEGREFAKRCKIAIEKADFDFGNEKAPVPDFKTRAREIKNK